MTRSSPSFHRHLLTRSDLARLQVPAGELLAWLTSGALEQLPEQASGSADDPVFAVPSPELRARLASWLAANGKPSVVLSPERVRPLLRTLLARAPVAAGASLPTPLGDANEFAPLHAVIVADAGADAAAAAADELAQLAAAAADEEAREAGASADATAAGRLPLHAASAVPPDAAVTAAELMRAPDDTPPHSATEPTSDGATALADAHAAEVGDVLDARDATEIADAIVDARTDTAFATPEGPGADDAPTDLDASVQVAAAEDAPTDSDVAKAQGTAAEDAPADAVVAETQGTGADDAPTDPDASGQMAAADDAPTDAVDAEAQGTAHATAHHDAATAPAMATAEAAGEAGPAGDRARESAAANDLAAATAFPRRAAVALDDALFGDAGVPPDTAPAAQPAPATADVATSELESCFDADDLANALDGLGPDAFGDDAGTTAPASDARPSPIAIETGMTMSSNAAADAATSPDPFAEAPPAATSATAAATTHGATPSTAARDVDGARPADGAASQTMARVEAFLGQLQSALLELAQRPAPAAPPAAAPPAAAPLDVAPLLQAVQVGFDRSAEVVAATSSALATLGERVGEIGNRVEAGIDKAVRAARVEPRELDAATAPRFVVARSDRMPMVLLAVATLVIAWAIVFWVKTGSPKLALGTLVGGNLVGCCLLASWRSRT